MREKLIIDLLQIEHEKVKLEKEYKKEKMIDSILETKRKLKKGDFSNEKHKFDPTVKEMNEEQKRLDEELKLSKEKYKK